LKQYFYSCSITILIYIYGDTMAAKLYDAANADFPDFRAVDAKEIVPLIKDMIKDNVLATATLLEQDHFTWRNLIVPLEEMDDSLAKVWAMISHIHAVCSEDELRLSYEKSLVEITQYYTDLSHNIALYNAFEAIKSSTEYAEYDAGQKKVIQNNIRDFKLFGVHLAAEQKAELSELSTSLSKLSNNFEQNILDATYGYTLYVNDKEELAGIPEAVVNAARELAKSQNHAGWGFNLDAPTFLAVMRYAENRKLRENLYKAYVTRASEVGPNGGTWDNSGLMLDILQKRQQQAKLLGFKTYADLSLATKMANDVAEVNEFLTSLANKAIKQAKDEYKELVDFIKQEHEIQCEPWDMIFYSELLRLKKYSYSSLEYKEYFSVEQAMSGLFDIVSRVFSLKICPVDSEGIWHKDVNLFAVFDKDEKIRGYFYTDLYARPKKRGGAWMDDCRVRRITKAQNVQHPIAFLNCNFSPPAGGAALLAHDDVVTLFHEFGHTLHHILTQVDYADISGISGVMWDAVEFPSQFLEHWCYTEEGLNILAKHYKTGVSLPEDMRKQLLLSKNFQSGMQMMRQLEFSIFDINIYANTKIDSAAAIGAELDHVRAQYAVAPVWKDNRFQHSFSHIFAGGYAAGYYSYKWAEVLSADAFALFEDLGIFNQDLGTKFVAEILEQGGTYDAKELFINFRGREPDIAALLRHSGIE
jgi:oligopeptidase A